MARFAGAWLVFLGGAAGALLRYLLTASSSTTGFDWRVFLINIVGAFLLALLVGWISGDGQPSPGQLRLRLLLGTGMMGGFTTYSTFALALARQIGDGMWLVALAYSLGTVLVGAAASLGGLWLGRRAARAAALRAAMRSAR